MRIKDGTRRTLVGRLLIVGVMLASVALAGCTAVAQAHGTTALHEQNTAHASNTTSTTSTTSTARTSNTTTTTRARNAANSARASDTARTAQAAQGCPLPPVGLGTATYGAAPRGAAAHEVALTFDDGPSASSSPAILSFLERTHTPATFFVIGSQVKSAPGIVQREARDGFVIGVHTWDHPDLTKLSASRISQELTSTEGQIHSALGAGYCVRYFRPPYGAYNSTVLGQARAAGLAAILWNVDPTDWARPGTQTIVNRVLKQVKAGSIILMHDGPSNRQQTAAALPSILAGLKARGLTPVTLPQLLANAAGGSFGPSTGAMTKTTTHSSTRATKSGTRTATRYTPAIQHRLYTTGKTTTERCEHDGDHDADDNC